MDIVNGNIRTYSYLLNGEEQIEMLTDLQALTFSCAMFNSEKEEIAKENECKKKEKELEKATRKSEKEKKTRRRGISCYHTLKRTWQRELNLFWD